VKLRTFDNLFVRIPNETLIKSQVTTLTRFPIRRLDLSLGVAYKENVERVRQVLMAVAERNPLCMDEPQPLFIFLGFGDSALTLQFSVWATRQNFLALRNSITAEIKAAFDEAGIEIPFPAPFPLRRRGHQAPSHHHRRSAARQRRSTSAIVTHRTQDTQD
jgi:small-conductance mechanosensitive channel